MERDFVRAGAAGDVVSAPEGHPEEPQTATEATSEGPDREWAFYNDLIKTGLEYEKRWRHEAARAERQYFGPDEDVETNQDPTDNRKNDINDKTALIHANVDVLKPLVYSNTPIPVVRRRFRGDGRVDPTALYCAEVGQRLAEYLVDTEDFDATMQLVRDDRLIAGRGVSRVVYKADFEPVEMTPEQIAAMAVAGEGAEPPMRKTEERVCPVHMDWRRAVFAPSESWRTMPWIAYEVPMTRAKIEQRFGKEKAEQIGYNSKGLIHGRDAMRVESEDGFGGMRSTETGARQRSPFDTATIWEFWNREEQEVVWFSPEYPYGVLDRISDPLGLKNFFPSPKPILSSRKGDTMTPRPDIAYYENRANEIKKASAKLEEILNVMSVSAFVPGQMQDDVQRILSGKSQIIPIAAWMKFLEKGGASGIMQWLPLDAMVVAIQALVALREQAKMAMFEASGVSDLMRAQGDPNETATAQELKGRYAGMRLSDLQKEAAIHARDLLNLMMEIALEHFDTETIARITDLDLPVTEAERMQIAVTKQMQEQAYADAMEMVQVAAALAEAGMIDPSMVPEPPPEPPKVEVPPTSYEAVHAKLRDDFMRQVTLNIETDSTILADEASDKEQRIEFLSAFSQLAQGLMPMVSSGQITMATIKELLLFGIRGFPKARTLENMINDLPDEVETQQAPAVEIQVAQIKGEIDKEIAALESADKQKDRDHERQMKGVDLVADAAQMAAEGAGDPPAPPPEPQPQGA
jgi:hypothetical protein